MPFKDLPDFQTEFLLERIEDSFKKRMDHFESSLKHIFAEEMGLEIKTLQRGLEQRIDHLEKLLSMNTKIATEANSQKKLLKII